MTDDLGAHDVEELRALMRKHHLLPDVPATLLEQSHPAARTAPPVTQGAPAPAPTGSADAADGTATPREDASEALLAHILATPRPAEAPARTTSRRRARLRRRSAALAVAAATVVVAVVGSQITSTPAAVAGGAPPLSYTLGSPAGAWDASLPSARGTLVDLAEVAEDAPDIPQDGDVQYVALYSWASELDADSLTAAVYPTADHRWVAADGAVRVVQNRAEAVTYDGRIDTAAGPSAAGSTSTDDLPAGSADPTATADLPTEPGALASALTAQMPAAAAQVPAYRDVLLAESVVQQYQFAVVPQDVASAMWTVLADSPTVRLVGETSDRLGRAGVAVAVPDPVGETSGVEAVLVLIISPADGQLLATETVTLTDSVLDVAEPTVTGFTTITDRRWVAAVGD